MNPKQSKRKAKLPEYPANGASLQAQHAVVSTAGESASHTPTPLESLISTSPNGKVTMAGIENYLHSPYVDKQLKDNLAAHIVKCVNLHEELVQLLGDIQYTWTGSSEMNLRMVKALNKAEVR